MEYHFRYNGPKSETKVRDCALCHTAARGKCVLVDPPVNGQPGPAHDGNPVVGCPHCDAAKSGICPSHCGIEKALAAHAPHETDPENSEWQVLTADDRGIVRQRVPQADSPERQARIDKAAAQFNSASAYVREYCASLPECLVDVQLRADDVDKVGAAHIDINAFPLPE